MKREVGKSIRKVDRRKRRREESIKEKKWSHKQQRGHDYGTQSRQRMRQY